MMDSRLTGTRRVVITGLGTVNPLGLAVAHFWESLCAGRSGIGPIEQFDVSAFPVRFGGEVKGFDDSAVPDPLAATVGPMLPVRPGRGGRGPQ